MLVVEPAVGRLSLAKGRAYINPTAELTPLPNFTSLPLSRPTPQPRNLNRRTTHHD
jgi:hypothetical protein